MTLLFCLLRVVAGSAFTYKRTNLSPGECPRRFLDSDREISHTSSRALAKISIDWVVHFFSFSRAFSSVFFYGNCGSPYIAQIVPSRKRKEEKPAGQASEWTRKIHVQNFRVYQQRREILTFFVGITKSKITFSFKFLGFSVGSSLFACFCFVSNTGRLDLWFFVRKFLSTCLGLRPTGSCHIWGNSCFRHRWEKA